MTRAALLITALATLTLGLGVRHAAGCGDEPLFAPDRFHLELLRQWDAETGGLHEDLAADWVCLAPTQPVCYCAPHDTERILGGLAQTDRIDLNLATRDEIEALPGVGPALAERILEYRKLRSFASVDELMEVPGIGAGRFRRLEPLVTVREADLTGSR